MIQNQTEQSRTAHPLWGKVTVFPEDVRWRWVGQNRYSGAVFHGYDSRDAAIEAFGDYLEIEKTVLALLRASGPQSYAALLAECKRQANVKDCRIEPYLSNFCRLQLTYDNEAESYDCPE